MTTTSIDPVPHPPGLRAFFFHEIQIHFANKKARLLFCPLHAYSIIVNSPLRVQATSSRVSGT